MTRDGKIKEKSPEPDWSPKRDEDDETSDMRQRGRTIIIHGYERDMPTETKGDGQINTRRECETEIVTDNSLT